VNNQFYVQLAEVRVHETVSVPDQVQLTWTAPGDDGATGTAASYDVRYSTSVINAVNFDAATQAAGEPSPHAAGTPESFLVTGLAPDTQYFFAVKTRDESNNVSNISNVPSVTTGSP
jgi:phosphodiesterase/alkaline phosphatase D-like protein